MDFQLKETGFDQVLLSKHAREILVQVDKMLSTGYFGADFSKYSETWLEVHLTDGEADTLQEFHEMIEAMI